MGKDGGAWAGFLVMAFAVLGLVGAAGIYAAQIPFERALARSAALDQALAVSGEPDAAQKLADLAPALDDSAGHILHGPGDIAERVADERARMFAAFGHEARDIGLRLRIVLAVFTAAGALFGVAVLSVVRREVPQR